MGRAQMAPALNQTRYGIYDTKLVRTTNRCGGVGGEAWGVPRWRRLNPTRLYVGLLIPQYRKMLVIRGNVVTNSTPGCLVIFAPDGWLVGYLRP